VTPVQRLTGDFITSSEIGHLKKLGTVTYKSTSLTIFFFFTFGCLGAEKGRENERAGMGKRGERVGLKEKESQRFGDVRFCFLSIFHLYIFLEVSGQRVSLFSLLCVCCSTLVRVCWSF